MGTKTKGKKPKVSFDAAVSVNNMKAAVATQANMKLLKKTYKGRQGRDKRNGEPKSSKGDPVSVTSGDVYQEGLDVVLPGLIRVEWKRHYTSGAREEFTPLGKGGWTHSFHQWIEVDGERTVLRQADGGEVVFASIEPHGTALLRGERLVVRRGGDTSYVVFDLARRQYREFRPLGSGRRCMLRSIRDVWENRVDLQYEGDHLVRIVAPAAREIRVARDARGRVTRLETWGRGSLQQQVAYAYTPEGELASVTDTGGAREAFSYDGLHRMVQATHKNGIRFHYRYDEVHGRCVKTWGDGRILAVELTYDLGERTTTTHGEAAPRVFRWNEDGLILSEATLDGRVVEAFEYDDDGLLLSRTNSAGEKTTFEYDERGNCVKETDPAGNSILLEYVEDRPVRRVDAGGIEKRYAYDSRGALLSATTATGFSRSITYDGYGRVVGTYGPDGTICTYEYDDEHNRIAVTDWRGSTTRYTFDALGYPTTMTDALGRVWRAEYDARRHVVANEYPDGRRATRRFDASDHVIELTDPDGGISRCEYVGSGVLSKITYPDGRAWTFSYDRAERLISVKNPKAETYEFVYDAVGRVVEETAFDGRTLKYAYHATHRISRIEYPDGHWRTFQYDPLGNVVLEQSPHGPISVDRDALGRMTTAVFEEGGLRFEIKRAYDENGRLVSEDQDGTTIRWEHDRRGRRIARILPGGETTRYEWDPEGKIHALEHDGVKLVVQRDVVGREVLVRIPQSGLEVRTAWNPKDQPVEEIVTAPASGGQALRTALSRRTWQYDARGRLHTATDDRWGSVRYEHDYYQQLVEEARDGQRVFFEYDAGAALQEILADLSAPRRPWSIEAGGLLRRTADAEYEYDANHQLKRKIHLRDWKPTGEVTEYTWDARQQLREVRLPTGERVRFFYDVFGRRCRKEVTSALSPKELAEGKEPSVRVVRFLWDGHVMCQEVDSEQGKRVFVHYPRSYALLFQQEQGEVFLCLDDTRGVPAYLIDTKARVAWAARHSAWGHRLEEARDPASRFARPIESPFRLMGHYFDSETGLCSTHARYFDQSTARWISPDPIGLRGGPNLFMFNFSPVVAVDPWGLAPVTVDGSPPRCSGTAQANDPNNPGSGGQRTIDNPDSPDNGNTVYYTSNGFPVFDPYAAAGVQIPFSGKSGTDIDNAWAALEQARANGEDVPNIQRGETDGGNPAAWGVDEDGRRYTWHHREDIDEDGIGTLLLVPTDIHKAIQHTGGDAVKRAGGCKKG